MALTDASAFEALIRDVVLDTVQQVLDRSNDQEEPEPLLTTEETAERAKKDPNTIRIWSRDPVNPCPSIPVGRRERRYQWSKVLAWLEQGGPRKMERRTKIGGPNAA